jgi:hypothetical protein
MPRGPCSFRQQDVTRALKATVAAGIDVQRIEIDKDGKIVIVIRKPRDHDGNETSWDRALSDETH